MCGIAGVFGAGDDGAAAVDRMIHVQRHRGPDGAGTWRDARVALGHRRLAVLDPTDAAAQPMTTPDGRYRIVYNGEIFNFRSLKKELEDRGHGFRSASDAEVALNGYAEWGPDCLARFEGMFAFAVYDGRREELFLARDRLGIKPLYVYQGDVPDAPFVFASEVRALLASGLVPPRLDPAALRGLLWWLGVPGPLSLVEGVTLLPPGHWMRLSSIERRLQPYWRLRETAADRGSERSAEAAVRLRGRLEAAVERHLVSDAPLGAFLSGGLDSSALVALASRLRPDPLTTVTFVHAGAPREAECAREVAEALGTRHVEVALEEDELLDRVSDGLAAQDQPTGDGINTYVVASAARRAGLTVALSGLGADELFGGYPTFRRLWAQQRVRTLWRIVPLSLRKRVASGLRRAHASVAADKLSDSLLTDGSTEQVYPVLRRVFSEDQIDALLTGSPEDGGSPTNGVLRRRTAWRSHGWGPDRDLACHGASPALAEAAIAETRGYLHDVLLRDADQMGMAHSLEIRVPYLDREVVEYAMRLEDRVARPLGSPKGLLREAVADLLPPPVLERPKQGFALPFDRWMRDGLRSLCERELSALCDHPLFEADSVIGCWRGFQAGNPRFGWSRAWLLVAVGAWLRRTGLR